jgi:hypothetical protein
MLDSTDSNASHDLYGCRGSEIDDYGENALVELEVGMKQRYMKSLVLVFYA